MDPGWFQTADELYEQIFRETVRKKGDKLTHIPACAPMKHALVIPACAPMKHALVIPACAPMKHALVIPACAPMKHALVIPCHSINVQ
jgi:hypothetical protein